MSGSASFVQLAVGFLLGVTGIHVITSCPLELDPPSLVVEYGDRVSVNCSATSTTFEGMGWEASVGGTGLRNTKHAVWEVDSLQQWTVAPKCFLNEPDEDDDFTQCFKELQLIIYKFPDNSTISSSADPSGVMVEGEEYTFTCVSHQIAPVKNLTVQWYLGHVMIKEQLFANSAREPQNVVSRLKFTPSESDNGLNITCLLINYLGADHGAYEVVEYYELKVLYGPIVKCSTNTIMEGETLDGRCEVTGNPVPLVIWERDGQPIDPTEPLTRETTGLHVLTAEGFRNVSVFHPVFVSYAPELYCPSNYTIAEHTPHNFTCTVQGYPRPTIKWYKDYDEVEPPGNLSRTDSGQYTVIATNAVSAVSRVVEISVSYPPTEIAELEDTEVDIGDPFWLKCSSTGYPRPRYHWSYFQSDNVQEQSEDGVSRLHVHQAKVENMGIYTCTAWNERGMVSKEVGVTVKGAVFECPLKVSPHRVMAAFGGPVQEVICQPTLLGYPNLMSISWLTSHQVINSSRLLLDPNKDWDQRPHCVATFQGLGTCHKSVDFTVYKTPSSVSIHSLDNLGPVSEGSEYVLQCIVTNVAPADAVIVQWYQGNETMEINGTRQVERCSPHRLDCDQLGPLVSVAHTISITVDKRHNGEEFSCAAHLDLGTVEAQLPPAVASNPVNITVYYKPIINATKLPKKVPLFRGYPEDLVCEAVGHPPPRIQWLYSSDKVPHESGGTLTVLEDGYYTCKATNDAGFTLHEVEVILNEDYLPLIAGFVAVTVVVISIIFVFIYSIYYKNTKMRRYSLKNPKFSSHNGNVAHNGLDLQFPMSKLS